MKDLEKLREMILTEMGKPTKILKEEGKKSIEINTQLTEEEKKDIESLLGK
ncbi:MAG: hypothetical protein LBU27_09220 [Candidatus Peribacteria bacterium]|jgi:hypothetical protein|nr:hypothetical protein [Candidatus Peribacteria bacterium]